MCKFPYRKKKKSYNFGMPLQYNTRVLPQSDKLVDSKVNKNESFKFCSTLHEKKKPCQNVCDRRFLILSIFFFFFTELYFQNVL